MAKIEFTPDDKIDFTADTGIDFTPDKPTPQRVPGTIALPPGGMGKIGAWEPSAWERVRDSKIAAAIAGNYAFLLDPSTPMKRGEDPLIMGLGKVAHLATSYGVGRGLYAPELIFGADLAERVHRSITEYELKPKEKTVGEVTEFIGALKTAGQIAAPLVGLMKAGETITAVTGGAATFILRNLSEQTVDKIKKGEPFDRTSLFIETFIGAAFGFGGVGVAKAEGTIRWLKSAARSPAGKRVPLRLWLRAEEAARAFGRPKMTQKTWDKLYKKDMEHLGKAFYDAHAAETLRRVPRLTGKTQFGDVKSAQEMRDFVAESDLAWKTSGYQPLARRGDVRAVTPPVKRLAPRGIEPIAAGIYQETVRLSAKDKAGVAGVGFLLDDGSIIKGKTTHYNLVKQVPKGKKVVDAGFIDVKGNYLYRDDVISGRAEPHLFLPMTQLMKRVPTPGVIPPKRRVLTPQPTALATVKKWERLKSERGPSGKPLEMPRNPIVKWSLDYMHARNADIERSYGFNPGFVPRDPSFVRRRAEILKTMAKSQEKYAKRYQKKLDAGVEPRNINVLNPVSSARYMWMQIDDRYGVPVWLVADHMYGEVGRGVVEADNAVRESIQARHLVGITKADDEKIADWLNSNDTKRNILAKDMSTDTLMLAAKEDDLLQGKLAHEMKMMIAGRWIDTGDMPSDIKHFVPVAKEWQTAAANKNYIAGVLRDAKAADDASTLLDHVTNVEPWKSGLGVRKNYYMSSPDESDIIDDTMYRMGIGVFEAPPNKANLPGTYSYEAKPRRGRPRRKGGSTLNNIYNKYTRIAAMNRARKDMRIISDRLQYVQLSASDKSALNATLSNMLHKGTVPKKGFRIAIKIKRIYWTTSFSPFVRPGTAIYRIIRNAPQNIAFGPFGISMPEALKHATILTENRGKLHEFDPEMMRRFDRNFAANVSQRKAMWTEFYMQDVAKITQDFDRRALTNKAIGILEWSGTGYMAVDEFSRKCIWMTEYQVVKSAMQDFLDGKINQEQFYNRTKLDTVHRQQQLLVHDMVSNGRVDDMAELAADWLTEDVNMKYKTESRSLIEQSPEERVFFGPITFNRGRLEHGYYRGIRAFLDGVSENNPGKAYRGATNIIKGITMSTFVSAALGIITGKRAYDITKQFGFGLLDPGTSKFHEAAQRTLYNLHMYSSGEQGLMRTIDNTADAWATVGESLFIPFSIEMSNIYEANLRDPEQGKAGVTMYRLIRNGVAAKLGIDVKEFDIVSRTRRQAVVHALWGSEERPKKEPAVEGRPTRGRRSTRE